MIKGKMIFNWNVPEVAGGDPKLFVAALVDAGFEGICLKAGDGAAIHRPSSNPNWGENVKPELVDALHDAGLYVYLWHFVYGNNPSGELKIARQVCDTFKPDGYIWDVERSFDSKSKAVTNASIISEGLRSVHPTIPQALCWWALPKNPDHLNIEWHPIRVAKAFLKTVDCVMPMMYWQGETAAHAISYLENSLDIWKTITNLPIIPVGRAYTGDGGTVTSVAVEAFAKRVMELKDLMGFPGINWWSLDKAYHYPPVWSVLKDTPRFEKSDLKFITISEEEVLSRLVSNHRSLFPEFFGNGQDLPFKIYIPEVHS